MLFWLLFLIPLIQFTEAASTDLCDIVDMPSCSGVYKQTRRSSAFSLPTPSASANINPSTVSVDRGIGAEVMYHPYNPLALSFATGTGRTGAALLSSSLENSFFGNRTPELEDLYLERRVDKKRYDPEKLSLAAAAKLINKKNFGLDAGIILKRHSEIKRINPGAGLSARLGPFNVGASYYTDDVFFKFNNSIDPNTGIPYAVIYNSDTYQEKFIVQTYSFGVKIRNLSLDMGSIRTKYKFYNEEDSTILIYSGALHFRNFMINVALRKETSPFPKYENQTLLVEKEKNETYFGLQYSLNRHVILGLHYNYFLLQEYAIAATVFY